MNIFRIISTISSYATTLLPITWELRNARVLKEAKGAVVMANHQSSMDILGKFCVKCVRLKLSKSVLKIGKKECFDGKEFHKGSICYRKLSVTLDAIRLGLIDRSNNITTMPRQCTLYVCLLHEDQKF